MIDFSVVIPTFNRAHLVLRAIESALAQTLPPKEIIVVDDGSTDNTRARISAAAPSVQYVFQQNAGAARARNQGVALTSSEWIAFLDSDDTWDPHYLETARKVIEETNGLASFYFTNVDETLTDRGKDLWSITGFSIKGEYEVIPAAADWVLMEMQPMMLPFTIFRKDAFLRAGCLWERLPTCEDTHLYLKLGLRGPACAVAMIGGRENTDEHPSNRLSVTIGSDTRAHSTYKIRMYRDILDNVALHHDERKVLVGRLADSYWRLSKMGWKEGLVREFILCGLQSAIISPGFMLSKAYRKLMP